MSQLKPNAYRVTYKRMEGDNYAGGWVNYTADIVQLGDLEKFPNIVSVRPIFIHLFDEVISQKEIEQALSERKALNERKAMQEEVRRAEQRLAEAKEKLEQF